LVVDDEVLRMSCKQVVPVGLIALVLTTGGCRGADKPAISRQDKLAVATTYADLVLASYDASVESATAMQKSIRAFTARPSAGTLKHAKQAWLTARDDYIPTEAFRFYGGPIDDPKDGPEGLINAWPLDEAYIDAVQGNPNAGIINSPKQYPKITADVIVEANEQGGETNISSGWHAIEFLLWGQDHSRTGPGDRPVSDYSTARNAPRRATYLRLTARRLVADLTRVRDQWAKRGGAFRAAFLADPTRAVKRMFRGIGTLTSDELAGQRMAVAYESKDQEDEHSCFSDNTNADIVNDLKGIRMVYLGEYPGVSGMSLDALVAKVDPDLAKQLRAELKASLDAAQAFPATFETMIAAPRGSAANTALGDAIRRVEQQGRTLAKAAKAVGVPVSFET
jgi:putative iron-regulated protein